MQSLRTEKNCLNCGAEVPERYCSHCGQENKVPHETFGHLFKHFVADIFHYDSQFFTTLKYLLFRPGFLSREYSAGRRVSYVNPIKLYVFVSFVCFFGIFALQPHENHKKKGTHEQADTAHAPAKKPGIVHQVIDSIDVISDPKGFGKEVYHDIVSNPKSKKSKNITSINDAATKYNSLEEYDSAQARLPDSLKDKGGLRMVNRRMVDLKERYGSEEGDMQGAMVEFFKHNLPKFMFILLPFFAMFMSWLYVRGKWLYSDHAIFTIHFHAFVYILSLVTAIFQRIFNSEDFIGYAMLVAFIYLVAALKNNYKQSTRKSVFKAFVLLTSYTTTMFIIFILAMILTIAVFV